MIESDWLTPAQAADHFGVSVKTIRRWLASGTLHGERIGPRLIRVEPRLTGTKP